MAKKVDPKAKSTPSKQQNPQIKTAYKIIPAVLVVIVVLFLIISNLLKKKETDSEYMFKKDGTLTFVDSLGNVKAKIDIQIADNDFDRELGLMFRKSMEENQGMLFIFPQETIQNFWMRNTFIPLDMIYINSKDEIVTIRNADKTLSDQTYSSTAPAQYVLEVNLGFANKFNIKVGDKMTWKRAQSNPEISGQ